MEPEAMKAALVNMNEDDWHRRDLEAAYRETFVFHKEDGEWKIVQMHASLAVPNSADTTE